jgi:hypothetical protein
MSVHGTSRPFVVTHQFGRYWRHSGHAEGVASRLWIREFESSRPSQPVRSPPLFAGGPAKSPRTGPIPRIGFSLRVPDWALIAAIRLSVSGGHFWYLVFRGAAKGTTNRRPPRGYRAKRRKPDLRRCEGALVLVRTDGLGLMRIAGWIHGECQPLRVQRQSVVLSGRTRCI